jgi:pre-mRNA-processing factor 39
MFYVSTLCRVSLANFIKSPFTVRSGDKAKLAEDGQENTTHRRMILENGHPGVEVDEVAFRKGENPYSKYFSQQGENPNGPNGQPAPIRYS